MKLEERTAFFDEARDHTELLGTSGPAGMLFLARTSDRHVSHTLFAKRGRGDMSVLGRSCAVLKMIYGSGQIEGRTMLDVGANLGTSIIAGLVAFGFSRGVAFEPEPQNFEMLCLNLALNGLEDRCTPLQFAVSDRFGAAELVVEESQSGKHWISTTNGGKRTETISVPTITLDALEQHGVADAADVGLLWMDAQLHEGYILNGATQLTERGVPVVFEWDPPGLVRAGERERLEGAITSSYSHFLDMRANPDPDKPPFELKEVREFPDFAEPFLEPDGDRRFTDVLALRLDRAQAEALDLSDLSIKAGLR